MKLLKMFVFGDMINCSALLAVPYLLRRDTAKLFDQRNNKQPTILCREAEIKLDDVNLLDVLNGDALVAILKDCRIAFTPDFIQAF